MVRLERGLAGARWHEVGFGRGTVDFTGRNGAPYSGGKLRRQSGVGGQLLALEL